MAYKKDSKKSNKKIIVLISIILVCIIIVTILLFINANKLNYVEEQTVDRIISFVNEEGFFNPKEARALDVIVKYKYNENDRKYTEVIDEYYIKFLGTNKAGGTINKCYNIYYADYNHLWNSSEIKCEHIYKNGIGYEQLSSNSIKNINKALQKYWNNLGI